MEENQYITISLQTNKIGSEVTARYDTGVTVEEWADLDDNEQSDIAKDLFWDYALNDLGEWDFETGDAS